MPVFLLPSTPAFPDPDLAVPEGLLAIGGDVSVEWLLCAYSRGIFPWYSEGEPLMWWSPDPRAVFELDAVKVSRSLRRTLRRGLFELRADSAFEQVLERCASKPRPGQDGTWLTRELHDAFVELHRLGPAHSIESWQDGELVGGLYGLSLGGMFCGESMFADRTDASKVALVKLAEQLRRWDFDFIDGQVVSDHLLRMGARPVSRDRFLERLSRSLHKPTRRGRWTLQQT